MRGNELEGVGSGDVTTIVGRKNPGKKRYIFSSNRRLPQIRRIKNKQKHILRHYLVNFSLETIKSN